jgi:hypothetical protein
MAETATQPDPPVRDRPIYWFALLEKSVECGDFGRAADATKELRRLGVEVTYRRRHKKEAAHV